MTPVLPVLLPIPGGVMNYNVIHHRRTFMAANALVQARVDLGVKEEATAVLAAMGLTVSDAVRMLLTKVAQEKTLPFELLTPNAETIAAMKEARRGGLAAFDSVEALLNDLNADD